MLSESEKNLNVAITLKYFKQQLVVLLTTKI